MSKPPNLLWIVTTQWRAQACGYAGDGNARTPVLDALAAGAANFRQAVTPHPFGPFARAALLTGVPSPENGVKDYFDPLPPSARTIAHELNDRGYTTAYFGKWHLAPRDRNAPLVGVAHARQIVPPEFRGGFKFWEGFEGGFQLNDPWLHGSRLAEPTRFPGYQANVVCERAADWIGECGKNADAPWFAVVSLESPHPPYAADAAGVTPRPPETLRLAPNVPVGGEIEVKARQELAGYYAHIEATDAAMGRLLKKVAANNVVVVVTSVHGDMHGAHGLFRKGWPYEESIRVPLLVQLPRDGSVQGWNGARDELVSLIDLSRWTLAWAERRSPTVGAPIQQISMPSVVALPHQCDRVWRGERTAKHKRVLELPADSAAARPWLEFDLERDPWEQVNLKAE